MAKTKRKWSTAVDGLNKRPKVEVLENLSDDNDDEYTGTDENGNIITLSTSLKEKMEKWFCNKQTFPRYKNAKIQEFFDVGRAVLLTINRNHDYQVMKGTRVTETVVWARHISKYAAKDIHTVLTPKAHTMKPARKAEQPLRIILVFNSAAAAAQKMPLITGETPKGAVVFDSPIASHDAGSLESVISDVGSQVGWRRLVNRGLWHFAYHICEPAELSHTTATDSNLGLQIHQTQTKGVATVASFEPTVPVSADLNASPSTSGPAISSLTTEGPQLTAFETVVKDLASKLNQARLAQLSEEERLDQLRYFGKSQDDAKAHCLTCGIEGHVRDACTRRVCPHCRAIDDHFSAACPHVVKCIKCREKGHTIDSCPSKLMRSNTADGLICDLCHTAGHGEEVCSTIWKTFIPEKMPKDELSLVSELLMHCYQCGSDRHWGDDCPMRPRHVTLNSDTFSAKYASRFLNDQVRIQQQKQVIYVSSGSEDEVQFILHRPRHPPATVEGHIEMRIPTGPSNPNYRPTWPTNSGGAQRGDTGGHGLAQGSPLRSTHNQPRAPTDSYVPQYGNQPRQNGARGYLQSASQRSPTYNAWQPPLPDEEPPTRLGALRTTR